MSFREDILATIEDVRKIPGELDIRQYRVYVVVTTWSGARVGVGTPTTTTTELLVSGHPPKVQTVSGGDIIASGGLLTNYDIKVGPITPQHPAGGTSSSVYDPSTSSSPTTVTFRIDGPTLPGGSANYERHNDDTLGNFSHYIFLRQTGRT